MIIDLSEYIVYLALLSVIIGIIFYYKLPNNKAKSLLLLIFYSFLTEFVGLHFKKWTGIVNFPIFNIYMFITFLYYIIFLKLILTKLKNQRVASIFLLIFLAFYILNLLFIQTSFTEPYSNSYCVGVILILILSCLYLLEIFNSGKILNFKKSIYFWFVLGILVFHVPFLPFMLAIRLFLIENLEFSYSIISFSLNLLMYSCFVIGFIWSEKRYNY